MIRLFKAAAFLSTVCALVGCLAPAALGKPRIHDEGSEFYDRVWLGPHARAVATARNIARQASFYGGSTCGVAQEIISFVQGLRYIPENPAQGFDDWLYPDQTLMRGGGDCEDVSILAYSMLKAVGIRAVLVAMPGHVALGVNLPRDYGVYYDFCGLPYYFVECTSPSPIGSTPPFVAGPVQVYQP